jgi:response regulator RpfG family c-di-GMP phosphodiesterase
MMNKETDKLSDEMLFVEEGVSGVVCQSDDSTAWKLLVVDDEPDIHRVTRLVLGDFSYMERSLAFYHAHTDAEARQLLTQYDDFAVILLDVVMEEDDSGLKLVEHIRNVLGNRFVRIILRTGQPGIAPLKRIIVDYDINDYKEKAELTDQKLFATMVASLREYEHLIALEENRKKIELNKRGLEKIIQASNSIFELQSLRTFAQGVLLQFESLSGLDVHSIYTQVDGFSAIKERRDFRILAGTGRYTSSLDGRVDEILNEEDLARIREAVTTRTNQFGPDYFVCQIQNSVNQTHILYVHGDNLAIQGVDRELIEVFNSNISIAFENLHLNQEIEHTQHEIIYTLGEVTEARSYETGYHVKRVGEYSRIMARSYGLDIDQANLLKLSAALHDVGKVGIPDAILNKPGPLTAEEFEVMKEHTVLGHKVLAKSERQILKSASVIAHQHHEHFDGSGYPRGLKGDEIDIFARIVAIADVFDALCSDRIYRPAWDDERIYAYIREYRGSKFDPDVVDSFFKALPDLLEIRTLFAD